MKQEVPIHQSLTRPITLAGADRELVYINCTLIAALVFGVGLHWITIAVSAFLATVGHWALVQITKRDPKIREVYVRHIQYQDYYPAGSSVVRRRRQVPSSIGLKN